MTLQTLESREFLHSHVGRSCRRSECRPWSMHHTAYKSHLFEKDAEIRKQKRLIHQLTSKSRRNAILILQMQVESFFHQLELQTLTKSVRELMDMKSRENQFLEVYSCEIRELEGKSEDRKQELNYELSEEDWAEIVGS
jgi:hypothetical protein